MKMPASSSTPFARAISLSRSSSRRPTSACNALNRTAGSSPEAGSTTPLRWASCADLMAWPSCWRRCLNFSSPAAMAFATVSREFALAPLPVDELRQRRVEGSLQRGVGGQRGHGRRKGADRIFLRNGGAAVLVLPFLRHGAERLDGVRSGIVRGCLRRRARLLVELLASRRRRQDALQRAGRAVE